MCKILLLRKHILIEGRVILDDIHLHVDDFSDLKPLLHQGSLGLHIVVSRRAEHKNALRVQDVLQIEDEILAPAELFIHAKLVLLHQLPPVEFIPDDAVIIIRRALRHASRELFPAQYALFVNGTLSCRPAVHNAVKIGNHKVRPVLLRGMYKKRGCLRGNPVVRIQKLEIFSAREIKRLVSCV